MRFELYRRLLAETAPKWRPALLRDLEWRPGTARDVPLVSLSSVSPTVSVWRGRVVAWSLNAEGRVRHLEALESALGSHGLQLVTPLPAGRDTAPLGGLFRHAYRGPLIETVEELRSWLEQVEADPRVGSIELVEEDLVPLDSSESSNAVRPSDPAFPLQHFWARIGVGEVWRRGFVGSGVRIGVVDRAFDARHPDLESAIELGASIAVTRRGDLLYGESALVAARSAVAAHPDIADHGTMVAGLAAARRNAIATVGAAFASRLVLGCVGGEIMLDQSALARVIWSLLEAQSDVICMSLGPRKHNWRLSAILARALDDALHAGRDGRGTLVVVAAPTSTAVVLDSTSVHAHSGVLAVGGCEIASGPPRWSVGASPCEALEGCGQIVLAPGRCTAPVMSRGVASWRTFRGTSAAAPVVAGIAALAIEAAPELESGQLKRLLLATAEGAENVAHRVSPSSSLGCVRADRLIAGALDWRRSAIV